MILSLKEYQWWKPYLLVMIVDFWQKQQDHRDGAGELRADEQCQKQCCRVQLGQIPVSDYIIAE